MKDSGLPIVDIHRLKELGEELVGPQKHAVCGERIVGVVEYRDGSVIDLIYCKE